MDSDLAEAVEGLKAVFQRRKIECSFGKTDKAVVEELRKKLKIPARYRAFLTAADPLKVETLDLLMSFEAWSRLRREQGLSVEQAQRVVETLVRRVIGDAGV